MQGNIAIKVGGIIYPMAYPTYAAAYAVIPLKQSDRIIVLFRMKSEKDTGAYAAMRAARAEFPDVPWRYVSANPELQNYRGGVTGYPYTYIPLDYVKGEWQIGISKESVTSLAAAMRSLGESAADVTGAPVGEKGILDKILSQKS